MKLYDEIVQSFPFFKQLRRDIHAHPELSFQEYRTAERIEKELLSYGLSVIKGLASTSVIGVLKGRDQGQTGRSIAIRADMDALPITELNTFEHASCEAGKMHACGHDGHVAIALAAAQYLSKQTALFEGTVYFIFQPAEEAGGGAQVMVQEGLFDTCAIDTIYALHNWPGLALGQVAVSQGPVMASSNEFRIVVSGKGAHAAMPHLAKDPIPVACELVQAFQTVISRNQSPIEAGVISVTMFHAGEATNVIPDRVTLQGTVRTFSFDVLDKIESRMREISHHLCAAHQMSGEFVFERHYPPTINHIDAVSALKKAAQRIVGQERVIKQEPTMGAEDFAYFLLQKPGAYFFLGSGQSVGQEHNQACSPCALHQSHFDFNDELIPIGASLWVSLVLQELGVK